MAYKPKYGGLYDPHAPRPQACGPRPGMWVTGLDPVEHKKYRVFIQQRNQANFRKEEWTMTFAEWKSVWDQSGQWENRGRTKDTFCMTRLDVEKPWTVDNAIIVTRHDHARRQGGFRVMGYRSPARQELKDRE